MNTQVVSPVVNFPQTGKTLNVYAGSVLETANGDLLRVCGVPHPNDERTDYEIPVCPFGEVNTTDYLLANEAEVVAVLSDVEASKRESVVA